MKQNLDLQKVKKFLSNTEPELENVVAKQKIMICQDTV